LVHSKANWVFQENEVLAQGVKILPAVIAIGLIAAAPARADELIDVAALEAQVEAATELAELPTEPDWGVPDQSNSPPVVTQDAPEVPPAPEPVAEAPAEPRYHADEPQYHAEYHAPESESVPEPAGEQTPAGASAQPAEEPATPAPAPISSPSTAPAATAQTPATPTIWIWVWNWSWDQGGDGRYRNTDEQYQIDPWISDRDITRITDKIGKQIPIQISVQTGNDIADEILREIPAAPAPIVPSAPVARPAPAAPLDAYRAPPETQKRKGAPSRRGARARSDDALEPAYAPPLDVATTPARAARDAASTPRKARGGKWPRARRVSRRAPSLPVHGERIADSAAASGASAGLLKTIAVLALALLLAAFGYGRRIWLPVAQLRGLLGTRTDPPG
jgi:hypothetical protein